MHRREEKKCLESGEMKKYVQPSNTLHTVENLLFLILLLFSRSFSPFLIFFVLFFSFALKSCWSWTKDGQFLHTQQNNNSNEKEKNLLLLRLSFYYTPKKKKKPATFLLFLQETTIFIWFYNFLSNCFQ